MVEWVVEGGKWLQASYRTQRPPRQIQISVAQKKAKTLRDSKITGTQQQYWMFGMSQTNRKFADLIFLVKVLNGMDVGW